MLQWKFYLTFALTCALAGCGGRVAAPIPVANSFDTRLSCSHLRGEYSNLLKRVHELAGESGDKVGNNMGMIAMGPSGLLFLDLSQTQKKELEAIEERKIRIIQLMSDKSCEEIPSEA